MADKRYSVDDIINEYSKPVGNTDAPKKSADELLLDYGVKKEEKAEDAAVSDTRAVSDEDVGDGFEKKYGGLSGKIGAVPEEEPDPDKLKGLGPDRSFSEKIEQGTDYPEDREEKESLAERIKKRKKTAEEKIETTAERRGKRRFVDQLRQGILFERRGLCRNEKRRYFPAHVRKNMRIPLHVFRAGRLHAPLR